MRRSIAFGLAFFCLGLMIAALPVVGAPPANDQCAGAETIPGSGPFPWLTSVTTNMHEATTLGDPPAPANCFGGVISNSAWYQFAPAVSGLYTVSTKFTATTMDSLLGIYTSPAGCAGPFTQYVCNDDVGDLASAVTTNFDAGTTYYILIWHTVGINPLRENERSLQLKVAKIEPAVNDICEFAAEIPSAGPFPYWAASVNTYLASTNNDLSDLPCNHDLDEPTTPQRSVWFKFRPATGGNYIIATCTNNTATTIYKTMLSVYENTGGCGGTMTRLHCNDGLCGNLAGVIMNMSPNIDYYVVVWDLASESDPSPVPDETDVQLFVERQGPPSVITIGHSNAQPTTVSLIGAANPKGVLTRAFFEWGTTTNYGNVTAPFSTLGAGIVDFPFSRALFDLSPGMTIHYRAAATNAFGVVFGDSMSVAVPFPQPDITSITREEAGVRMQFTGTEGYIHEVQVSEDLRNWTRLGDATPLEFDQFEYVDPAPLGGPQRFYRVKL